MSEKPASWGVFVSQTLVAALLSAGIIGMFVQCAIEDTRFTRDWKERSLGEVVGPAVMHLDRTARVAQRYRKKPVSYFAARIMRESNEEVRSILLKNGHLIPEDLREHAHRLVEHHDVWILRFDEKVAREQPNQDTPFDVKFATPEFPDDAGAAFKQSYALLRKDLYDQ